MYLGKSITVVFPAYNEEENIGQAIDDFNKLGIIDEILVIDNNSTDATASIARQRKSRVITEKKQGYGYALLRGMKEAQGDYVVLCEPDGTFQAKDLLRLLAYIDSYDMVIGSRTHTPYIRKGANMGTKLRFGNIGLAKVIQFLYRPSCSLSDCGCTFRVMRKSLVASIVPKLTVGGSYFLAEVLVTAFNTNATVHELPVHYRKRIGTSKITGSFKKTLSVGLHMFFVVVKHTFVK